MALRRGLPRTHRLAQARSVFAVASHRCEELYSPPGAVTLWSLPADIENEFEEAQATWIDHIVEWEQYFAELELCSADLAQELQRLDLITDEHLDQLSRLKRSSEQRAVAIPGEFTGSADDLAMLALGFARGEAGKPAVPFQSLNGGE